jgi:hypothetical protein
MKGIEAKHRTGDMLFAAVILFKDIFEGFLCRMVINWPFPLILRITFTA